MFLDNPIFRREFVALARSWKTSALISAYLVSLSLLLIILWPAGGIHSVVTDNSREIFSMFFTADLILLMMMVPAFTAGAITMERENETYQALFCTLMRPFSIMTGKLFSAILMLLILSVLSLPIAALCALTGGLDLTALIRICSILLAAAISYGLVGLACSSVCKRTSAAVVLTYGFLLLLSGATWLPAALLSNLLPSLDPVWQGIRSISPFDALAFLLYPDNYKAALTVVLSPESSIGVTVSPYHLYLFFSVLTTIFSFSVFYKNIRRPPQSSRVMKGQVYTEQKIFIKRKLTFPFYLLDPLRRKKPIGAWRNPVFVAEMRSKLFSNPQFVLRSISVILIISVLLLLLVSVQFSEFLDADVVRISAIVFQLGVVTLLAPGVSSSLITEEISCGTFQALRMTTISPMTVISGKLKATFFYAMIFVCSGILVFLTMTYLQVQDVSGDLSIFSGKFWSGLAKNLPDAEWRAKAVSVYTCLFAWIMILLLTTITCLSAGLFASTIAKNTSIATAMSYGFTGFCCIVTLLPSPLADKLEPGFARLILACNPYISAIQAAGGRFLEYPDLWTINIRLQICVIILFFAGSTIRVWYLFQKKD
ncbi:MAG: ABC transporter permease [Lentisphaeria bacterium]|nr:ABC transporter permease [Lentisphaeria bacterium]